MVTRTRAQGKKEGREKGSSSQGRNVAGSNEDSQRLTTQDVSTTTPLPGSGRRVDISEWTSSGSKFYERAVDRLKSIHVRPGDKVRMVYRLRDDATMDPQVGTGTAIASDEDSTEFCTNLNGHYLRANPEEVMIVIQVESFFTTHKHLKYPYMAHPKTSSADEKLPGTLGDFNPGDKFAWDAYALEPAPTEAAMQIDLLDSDEDVPPAAQAAQAPPLPASPSREDVEQAERATAAAREDADEAMLDIDLSEARVEDARSEAADAAQEAESVQKEVGDKQGDLDAAEAVVTNAKAKGGKAQGAVMDALTAAAQSRLVGAVARLDSVRKEQYEKRLKKAVAEKQVASAEKDVQAASSAVAVAVQETTKATKELQQASLAASQSTGVPPPLIQPGHVRHEPQNMNAFAARNRLNTNPNALPQVVQVDSDNDFTDSEGEPDDGGEEVPTAEVEESLGATIQSIGAQAYDASKYIWITGEISLDKITTPKYPIRDRDRNRVDELKSQADGSLRHGFKSYFSTMQITVRREPGSDPLPDDISESSLKGRLFDVVDVDKTLVNRFKYGGPYLQGGHRYQAMTELMQEAGFPQDMFDRVHVQVCIRRDGAEMTDAEILNLSGWLGAGQGSKTYSFLDLVSRGQAAFNLLRTHLEDADEKALLHYFVQTGVLCNVARPEARMYAKIVCYLHDKPMVQSTLREYFTKNDVLGYDHFRHRLLFMMDEMECCFTIRAICTFINVLGRAKSKKKKSTKPLPPPQSFHLIAGAFIRTVQMFYERIVQLSKDIDLPLTDIFAFSLPARTTVSEYCSNQMAYFVRGQKESILRGKITSYINCLRKMLTKTQADPPAEKEDGDATDSAEIAPASRPQRQKRKAAPTSLKDDSGPTSKQRKKASTGGSASAPAKSKKPPKFDDVVDRRAPIGFKTRSDVGKCPPPHYTANIVEIPWTSILGRDLDAVKHKELLARCGVPREHTAYTVLTDKDVLRVLRMVDRHAAWIRCEERQVWKKPHAEPFHVEKVEGSRNVLLSQFVSKNCDFSAEYFQKCKTELRLQGYTVLEGFAKNKRLFRHGPNTPDMREDIIDVMHTIRSFYKSKFKSGKSQTTAEAEKWWIPIVNTDTDADDENSDKGVGRYITTRQAMTTLIEQDKDCKTIVQKKCKLDVRVCVAATKLGITGDLNNPVHVCPKTGGRFLLTSDGCPRQTPHTDFPVPVNKTKPFEPNRVCGYFAIVSGDQPVTLWVCPGSHRVVAHPDKEVVKSMAKGMKMELITVPPYSIFYGRGDLYHGGAAHEDQRGLLYCIRYHIYFKPIGTEIKDAIEYCKDFDIGFDEDIPPVDPALYKDVQDGGAEDTVLQQGPVSDNGDNSSIEGGNDDDNDGKYYESGEGSSSDSSG